MRWTIALFALVLVAMQLEYWFAEDRRRALIELEAEVAAETAVNQAWAQRNADLAAEIASLHEGDEAVEERARSGLGLIGPNETYYQIAEVEGASSR